MTSEELYRRCIEGDQEAWTYAYNIVLAYLRERFDSAENIRGSAHAAILYFIDGGLGKVREGAAYKYLLCRKAYGCFIDRKRYAGNRLCDPLEQTTENGVTTGQNPAIDPIEDDPETSLFIEKALQIIQEALEAIGKECKDMLQKHFTARFFGQKVKDLASELGIPYASFRTMVHRCHKKLLKQDSYRELLEELN